MARGIYHNYDFTTDHLAQAAPGAHSGVSLCFNRSVAIARDPARPLGNCSAAANRCKARARRALPCIHSQIPPRLARRARCRQGAAVGMSGVGCCQPGNAGLQGRPGQGWGSRGCALGQWSAVELGEHPHTFPVFLTLALTLVIGCCVGWSGRTQTGVESWRRLFSSHPRRQITPAPTSGFDIQPTIAHLLGLKSES